MKIRLLLFVAALTAVTSLMTSCLNNDVEQVTYVSRSSITAFSVGTLHIDRTGKDSDGNDSSYVDTISCANYPFTIDQMNRTIENRDSFPVGTHIDKVVTSISYDDMGVSVLAYRPNGSQNDTVYNSTDSIDFTEPVQFRVYTISGSAGRPYLVKLNVHQQEPDTISWTSYEQLSFEGNIKLTRQTTVYADGKLYVFGEQNGSSAIQYTDIAGDTPSTWTTIPVPVQIAPYSAIAWNGRICFLSNTGEMYALDPATQAIAPEEGVTGPFDRLIAADHELQTLYAVKDGKTGRLSADGIWTDDEEQMTALATGKERLSAHTEALSYNGNITRTTVACHSLTGESATIYQRMSNDKGWVKIMQDQAVPNMDNFTMIYYDDRMLAFGGPCTDGETGPEKAFETFYTSSNYGVEWSAATECLYFPESFAAFYTTGEGTCSGTTSPQTEYSRGNFIWIVWENGHISRGRINRLGFDPKW